MLRDRYEPMNLFALVSALSLALDPVLTQLDRLLDNDTLFQAVKADLAQRFPRTPIDGRPSPVPTPRHSARASIPEPRLRGRTADQSVPRRRTRRPGAPSQAPPA